MQLVPRFAWKTLGCVQIEVRAHWEDDESISATTESETDSRHASSSATPKVTRSATSPVSESSSSLSGPDHQASSSSAADTTTSAAADHAAAPVDTSSAPSKTVSWAVLDEDVIRQHQPVEQAGTGLGEEGSSMDASSDSTRK